MRVALWLIFLATCGPKVDPKGPIDEDLGAQATADGSDAPVETAPRVEAAPGKGERAGTIARAKLLAVLDRGPGVFLSQLDVTPKKDGSRFIGWQLVQIVDHDGSLHDVDIVPGDVLLAVNGKPISRPEQLQTIWDSLRTANSITAQLWRGDAKFELQFAIAPPVAGVAPPPATRL
ncbi:hypothetical protein BH11MYX1_BH11MYX1_29470 [soil metagenome]